MVSRVLCLAALLAVAHSQYLGSQPIAGAEPYDPNPQYSYSYNIQDPVTGDAKSQTESRNGDSVQGSYSLVEADGSIRTVEYTADAVNGFNAVVHKNGAGAPVAAPIAAPIAAAPIAARVAPAPYYGYRPQIARGYAGSPALVRSSFSTPYTNYAY